MFVFVGRCKELVGFESVESHVHLMLHDNLKNNKIFVLHVLPNFKDTYEVIKFFFMFFLTY